MRVAIVHDWLIHMRGGEKVLESFAEVFPDATIYTLFSDREKLSESLKRMKIKNSFLQYLPGIKKYYRWLLPLFPFVIKTLRIHEVDLVLSSSHCVAKGVRIPKGVLHVCYCHTPMRYLWRFEGVYFDKFPQFVIFLITPILNWLRKWDVESSKRVDHFFCNSEAVRQRIHEIYKREALVIHPPVNMQWFRNTLAPEKEKGGYYLVVSALTPYKRTDLVIEAFNGWDRKLLIAGEGPSRKYYEKLVKTPNIRFVGTISDEELVYLYSEANALLFPQEEDFGIVPLEAQACGTPVIAFAKGGALESVQEGVFFDDQSPEAIRKAVLDFEKKAAEFNPDHLRRQALQFDKTVFKTKVKLAIEDVVRKQTFS